MIQDMMSGGASVEETLDLWASGLRSAKERIVTATNSSGIRFLFERSHARERAMITNTSSSLDVMLNRRAILCLPVRMTIDAII